MTFILSILSILFYLTTSSELDCNGIEFEILGIPLFYPVGLCMSIGSDSTQNLTNYTKLECSEDGESVFISLYEDNLCSGSPKLNRTAMDMLQTLNATNFTMECCADLCEFGITRTYHINDCNESISNDTDYDETLPVYIGQCIPNILTQTSMKLDSCSDGQRLQFLEYTNSTECEGDFNLLKGDQFIDGFCFENNDNVIGNLLNLTNSSSTQFGLINIRCIEQEMQNVSCLLNETTTPNPTETTSESTMGSTSILNTTGLLDNGCKSRQIIYGFMALVFSLSFLW